MALKNLKMDGLYEIQLRGKEILTEDNIFPIRYEKYIDRRIIEYEDQYYLIYQVFNNLKDILHYWDFEGFDSFDSVLRAYNKLDEFGEVID
jgi:hypothetical protein